jgi:hypothetical protein
MGDAASGHSAGAGHRSGRRGGSNAGSSVLTPPTGMPAVPDLGTAVPAQRQPSPAPADTTPPPAQRTVVDPCRCGHGQQAHEHYRPGSDCGACGRRTCGEFRPENGPWRRFLRSAGLLH